MRGVGMTPMPYRPVQTQVRFSGEDCCKPKTDKQPAQKAKSFDEFWPQYLKAHSKKSTRAVHYAGTLGGLAAGAAALATGNVLLVPLAIAGTYGTLFSSHFLFEKNKPETLRHPLWSMRADFKMLKLFLTGKIKGELKRLNINPPAQTEKTETPDPQKKPN